MPTEYLSGTGQPIVMAPSAGFLADSPRMGADSTRVQVNPLYLAMGLLAVLLLYKKAV